VRDTERVANDIQQRVGEVLARADSLFGSATTAASAGESAQQLADAAEALRRNAAPDMAGAAVSGYSAFAHDQASALGRLADTDDALNRVLQDAASAENTAAAASHSAVITAAQTPDGLPARAGEVTARRALIAVLQSELAREQDLVRKHQQRALELAEQVRLLSYD
jgi:hypothetical protein